MTCGGVSVTDGEGPTFQVGPSSRVHIVKVGASAWHGTRRQASRSSERPVRCDILRGSQHGRPEHKAGEGADAAADRHARGMSRAGGVHQATPTPTTKDLSNC